MRVYRLYVTVDDPCYLKYRGANQARPLNTGVSGASCTFSGTNTGKVPMLKVRNNASMLVSTLMAKTQQFWHQRQQWYQH